jgi:hypothetical protein
MTKIMHLPMIWIAAGLLLVACGPSLAELDAQATGTAGAQSATQTAEAPTATGTPIPTKTPTPTPTATPTPTVTPTPLSPRAILEDALAAMNEADSYGFNIEMEMEISMEGLTLEVPFVLVGDYQAPDRLQCEITMTLLGETMVMEEIIIGGAIYVMVTIWDTTSWKPLHSLDMEVGGVCGLAWSPDSTLLASGSCYQTFGSPAVIVWDARSGSTLFTLQGWENAGPVDSLAWSPDGTLLAGGSDGSPLVLIWDLRSRPALFRFPARHEAARQVLGLAES